MKINIVAEKMELTGAVTDYVSKKVNAIEKLLDTSGDKEAMARVELGKETKHHQKGDIFVVEVHLSHRKEKYNASAKESDLYAAIDKVKDELSREIKNVKGKKGAMKKEGCRKIKKILHGEI